MTENEAIQIFKNPCHCDYDLSATIENCNISSCDKRDAARMAIQALEKHIPKKLLNYNKISAAGNCPGCMAFVDSYYAYCSRCGQRLEEEP